MATSNTLKYTAVPTLRKVHRDSSFYRGVMGPVRSGKSTGMSMEIMRRVMEQRAGKDGIRRSIWAIVRNTYGELRDTTLKTWMMWFPQEYFGKFNRQEMIHRLDFNDVYAEVMFRALDRPDDVAKLLSMELTGAWVNEAREVPKAIVDTLGDRVGQYPPPARGGCSWSGVMMDSNPPDEDHWWYKLAEEERPEGWQFFRQPGGLVERGLEFYINPKAENLNNLNEGADYYLKRLPGKSKDYIRVYYCAQYGFVIDGKPVIPEYIDAVHCATEPLTPVQGVKLYIGLDFGLTPAAIFMQRLPSGRWIWLDELCAEDMGISRFADVLKPKIANEYRGFEIEIYGDPSGDYRAPTDERTPFQILDVKGIKAIPAPTNDFTIRRESIAVPLQRFIGGKPGLMISPKCKRARKGLAGGYCYRRMKVSGDERFHDKPDKNLYSHPVEAGGYALLGGGEGEQLTYGDMHSRIVVPGTVARRGRPKASGWMQM